jgi:hypothetical protein
MEQAWIIEHNREKTSARDKRADDQVLLAFYLFHRLFAAHQLASWFASTWLIN